MRVLALTNLYPNPWQPQRATFNRLQFRVLAENHCPVRVIAPIAWSDELRARRSGKPALPACRRVELDGLTVDHPRMFYTPGMMRRWYGRFFRWSVRSTFWRLVKELEPTIVYAPWVYPDGWAAIQLAREAGLPVVLQALGSDILLLDQYPGRRAGTTTALRSADAIVAVSQDLATKICDLGADNDRVRVIYNGLDKKLFCPGSKAEAREAMGISGSSKQLLFIGNLVPVKGIDLLLRACRFLKTRGHDFVLNIIGEGRLRQSLTTLSHTLDVSDRVQWHGSVPQSQLPLWYRAADLVVLPSRSEGVPNVLLEATGCNTPWVATRVGGIPEIKHFGNNRLVAPESVEELANAMQIMMDAPDRKSGNLPSSPQEAVSELVSLLTEVQSKSSR